MPRKVELSQDDLEWLHANHSRTSHKDIAARLGVCTDTAKRILARLGLQNFPGAKYAVAQTHLVKTWNRPCLTCGDKSTRPKGWFFCRSCRLKRGYDNDD